MEYQSLKQIIETIIEATGVHICIHDVSGILKTPGLSISYNNATHKTAFCDLAKSTESGYELCMKCKGCSNQKAIAKMQYFSGLCAFGLFEAVKPVVVDGKTVCIVYVGRIINDLEASQKKLANACEKTGAPFAEMKNQLFDASKMSEKAACGIAQLIDSYIRMIYEKNKSLTPDSPYHWAVYNLKKYADENYARSFTLSEVCRLYFINEKYAGRLFGDQIGMSFHEYLNLIRLEKATEMLLSGDKRIIDIALECGFNNVTYFNRRFREKYSLSPGQYRRKSSNKA